MQKGGGALIKEEVLNRFTERNNNTFNQNHSHKLFEVNIAIKTANRLKFSFSSVPIALPSCIRHSVFQSFRAEKSNR